MDVAIVGAGGTLGTLIAAELGGRAVAVPRDRARDPAAIAALRPKAIVCCAGASVAMGLGHGWRGYRAVDTPIGLASVAAAKATGARLVYVAPVREVGRRTAYVDAHERVVEAMTDGTSDACVVRATGFYRAFSALLPMARRGWLVDLGDGTARTNPVDERDLAEIVVAAIDSRDRELAVGGPDVLTRAELFGMVAAHAGRRVRTLRVPRWLGSLGALALRPLHPRIAQFARFACAVAGADAIAPRVGTRRFGDYLAMR